MHATNVLVSQGPHAATAISRTRSSTEGCAVPRALDERAPARVRLQPLSAPSRGFSREHQLIGTPSTTFTMNNPSRTLVNTMIPLLKNG